ncbi:MAG: cbb3-type cytochrome oxidase assembly protein CcoS [Salibacteraceae bacterium]|jgi:cbb3-type cytochrome oxidase maturation protein|nr:cbb3-type cytochrome oxidase assembly protein CcoS [Salibacteraceae bacterium]MDP4685637.1 cbb3-type cytochrome oxidase assembly protein CcoS [Salibacteraceae bacterium]MDP4763059.1 cbb3-type cytochrome oxidase assembly protein CcoS [Salibacteraceae bacterium]MDP4843209.1 cbb3-type cytochrome oxidase assembly protein CcoS [Salibacteraceae bacterium]MDP4934913.1 cbb3-type cytochrome oxidase assembly protein CcoS [Salibacteraceae bacterium]
MSVMIIHIVVSLIIALGFLGAFIWAIKTNQYDDDYSPAVRILFDDEKKEKSQPITSK